MAPEQAQSVESRKVAAHALIAATRRVSESLSSFSGWLMAGFGGAFSLIVANVQTVSKFISLAHIRCALLLFLMGLVVAVLARLLGNMTVAAVASHDDGEALAKKIRESGNSFDTEVFAEEFQRGLFPWQRWLVKKSFKKARSGDVVAGARMIAKLSQVQAMLVLLHAVLAIGAAFVITLGLKV
jgi:hypothetical protein